MSKSINDIKNELANADKETRESLIEVYKGDTRKGVAKLIEKYEKQKIALEKEYKRLELMHQFENKYSDYEFIAGIDEAGRGPLAGPVVAASVILPKDCEILYLNDSKQVSAKKRDELFDEIKETSKQAIKRLRKMNIKTVMLTGDLKVTANAINQQLGLDEVIAEVLPQDKENVIKMGIPEKFCIGVSTSTLRKFAKKLDKSNELAFELWNTHYHEARLLAVLIFDYKCLSYDQIDTLMSEVLSWDLCDHLCKNLIIKLDYYEDFIFNWIAADHIYKKRASFVLIAASTIHDKSMTKETLDIYLKLVYENSCYEHDHIKKAVSWALREIGKTDFEYAEKVLLTAYDLLASGNKVQIWIAKDVIKELETVVKVKERKRLITSNSKMGRER